MGLEVGVLSLYEKEFTEGETVLIFQMLYNMYN